MQKRADRLFTLTLAEFNEAGFQRYYGVDSSRQLTDGQIPSLRLISLKRKEGQIFILE